MIIVERSNDVPCLQKIASCWGQGCHHKDYCLAVKSRQLGWKEKFENRTLTKNEYCSYMRLQFIKKHGYRIGPGIYTIRKHDTVCSVCDKFGILRGDLEKINKRKFKKIFPGEKIRIFHEKRK